MTLDGPLKSAFESDTKGVIYQEFITYKIENTGMFTKIVVTRRFKKGGDYHDTTSHIPLFDTKQEDVYGNLEGQARLRGIQDSAAGKPNRVRDAYLYSNKQKTLPNNSDDYEHTKEYYDTERNKAQSMTSPHKNVYDNAADIQTMTSDGLSNRTMKQKYGQAVQTVSEMMQEELEPLPINTFK
jgi:hypothetical protein